MTAIAKATVYGYLRVSTEKQEISTNKATILNFSNDRNLGKVIWIEETVSGRVDWRKRKLGQLFLTMVKDDIIIMSEFSRIGRNFLQSLEFISECKRKGVIVLSTACDIPIDDTATSNLFLALKGWEAQTERENISRRTKIALAKRKADGVQLGRHPGMILEKNLEENKAKIKKMMGDGYKYQAIAKRLDCNTTTLRKFIKKYNLVVIEHDEDSMSTPPSKAASQVTIKDKPKCKITVPTTKPSFKEKQLQQQLQLEVQSQLKPPRKTPTELRDDLTSEIQLQSNQKTMPPLPPVSLPSKETLNKLLDL